MASVETAQPSSAVNGGVGSEKYTPVETPETNGTTQSPTFDDSKLPTSYEDGVLKTPFGKPSGTIDLAVRPPLSDEQKTKYGTFLKTVLTWTELPETSAKGANSSPLSDSERMWLTRECLLRYLRATKWNLLNAETRLKKTLMWRRETQFFKDGADFIAPENETGKQVIAGWDKNGRTCLYLRPSKQNTERSPRQDQHMFFMLERCIDLMPPGQEMVTLLINFAETKHSQSVPLSQGKQVLDNLQNHYPERLGRALVTNLPFYIWGFFKLITPFIDPVTKEKIKFNEDMTTYVPKEQLLSEAGGKVELSYDHSTYWPALIGLSKLKTDAYAARWKKAGSRIGESENYLRGGNEKSVAETEAAAKPETETLPASNESAINAQ